MDRREPTTPAMGPAAAGPVPDAGATCGEVVSLAILGAARVWGRVGVREPGARGRPWPG